jgi:small conductance mechanosensitive channel
MDILLELTADLDWKLVLGTALRILLMLVIAWAALAVLRRLLARIAERLVERGRPANEPPSEQAKRVETLIRLVRQAVRIMVWVAVTLVVLRELGVDIAPILAGAGILGLAVGFGGQNLVRDVISGFFLILENQIRVGDVAVINGTGGLVEEINFRTTVLRDLSGVVHVFPNGTISTLSNMTHEWSAYVFDIGVAYKEQTDRVIELLGEVAAGLRTDPEFGPLIIEDAEIFGVDKLGDSGVVIKGRLKTRPIRQWAVGREFLRRVKNAFDEHGIEIPFPHRSLYFGAASQPIAVRLAAADMPDMSDKPDKPNPSDLPR